MTPQQFRTIRRKLGWSHEQLSWHLGVSVRSVYRYEDGTRAIKGSALKIMERLSQ